MPVDLFTPEIELDGDAMAEQRDHILAIANRCPWV